MDKVLTRHQQAGCDSSAEVDFLDPLPFLARAGEMLAASLDLEQTLDCLLTLVVPSLADFCSLHLLDDGGRLQRVAVRDRADGVHFIQALEQWDAYGWVTSRPVVRLLRRGTTFLSSPVRATELDQIMGPGRGQEVIDTFGVTSSMMVPLLARGHAIGIMALGTATQPIFQESHKRLAEDLARRAAFAIDSARMYQAAGASRLAAERARQRATFLAEASAALAKSLDVRTTLRTVVRLAVPLLVDACSVVLFDGEGLARRVAAAHVDPVRERQMNETAAIMPIQTHPGHPVARALAAGRPTVDNQTVGEPLSSYASGEYLEYLRNAEVTARMVVPLEARDRQIGALVLSMTTSERKFEQDDVTLGVDLAGRAALAIDNARLYQAALDARGRLERSEEQLRRALTTAETMMLERQAEAEELRQLHQRLQRSLEALLGIHEVGTLLTSPSGLDAVGRRVLEIAVRAARLRAAVLRRRTEPGNRLRLWQRVGDDQMLGLAVRSSAVARARGQALATEQTVAAEIGASEPGGMRLTAWCIPLRVKGETIGVLEAIGEPRLPDEPTVEILGSIALQASTALENARLYREIAGSERALHRLVQQLMQAQEEERHRLAYEIHDGFAQMVYGLQQLLEAYAHAFPSDSEVGRRRMEIAIELARRTVPEIRRVLAGLRPTVLDDFGLERGLCAHAEGLAESGLRVTVASTLGPARLPSSIEIALFRLAQEALTNVRKHAGTATARLSLDRLGASIVLEVEDRGGGFDQAVWRECSHAGEHMGLLSMRERITQIGGDLEIRSQLGMGTLVRAVVPLSEERSGCSDAPGRSVRGRLGAD